MWNVTHRRMLGSTLGLGVVMVLLSSAVGCGGPPKSAGPAGATNGAAAPPLVADPNVQFRLAGTPSAFYLDVYQVAVPFGAVSRNDDFWRRVDEELIDPATKDLLLKNGVRAGVASNDDWDFFKAAIEQHPHVARSGSAVATGNGQIELLMKENVPEQDIFFLGDVGYPWGRTYEKCDDLVGVSFWPDPRRRGEMRLSVSPTVRSTRTHLEYTAREEQRVFVEVRPEYLYQLNLRTTIPADRFVVIGLSPAGKESTSLGHQFLTLDGGVEMKEQVLILVPRVPQRKAPATTRSSPKVNVGGPR
jgi:hypothetical protein